MRRTALFFFGLFCFASLGGVAACKKKPPSGGGLQPLELRDVAKVEGVEFSAPAGIGAPAQVLMAFVAHRSACDAWAAGHNGGRFLLCTHAAADTAGALSRRALGELKAAYGEYVAPAPVLLVADEDRVELARSLLLAEPTFFSRAIVFSPTLRPFDSIALNAFGEQGGQALAVVTPDSAGLDRLEVSVRRLPLHFVRLAPGADARQRALLAVAPIVSLENGPKASLRRPAAPAGTAPEAAGH